MYIVQCCLFTELTKINIFSWCFFFLWGGGGYFCCLDFIDNKWMPKIRSLLSFGNYLKHNCNNLQIK